MNWIVIIPNNKKLKLVEIVTIHRKSVQIRKIFDIQLIFLQIIPNIIIFLFQIIIIENYDRKLTRSILMLKARIPLMVHLRLLVTLIRRVKSEYV